MSQAIDIRKLKDKYECFVIKKDGCWDWSGCKCAPGYGQFRCGKIRIRAHRASWNLHRGEIPEGMFVCHKCDNPTCSNPEHLFLGTHLDNVRDMIKKDRHPTIGKKGENNHRAILKISQVKKIKKILKTGIVSLLDIAKMFNVSKGAIACIKYGKNWRSV